MLWEQIEFDEWETLVRRVSELIVLNWDQRSDNERFVLMQDVNAKMKYILDNYPVEPSLEDLNSMKPWFREQALELIMTHMRHVQIYRAAPDAVLLENISENLITQMADHLMVVAGAFFRVVNDYDPTLATMMAHIEDWDSDADLRRLLEEEQDK